MGELLPRAAEPAMIVEALLRIGRRHADLVEPVAAMAVLTHQPVDQIMVDHLRGDRFHPNSPYTPNQARMAATV